MASREATVAPRHNLRFDSSHTRNWFVFRVPEDRFTPDDRWGDLLFSSVEHEGALPGFLRRRITSFAELRQQPRWHREDSYEAILGAPVDTSWSHSARFAEESSGHLEAAAVMDRLARGLLWKISDCTFIPGAESVGLIEDYDDVRAVVRVVAAGWVSAAPDGLLVTDRGRDVASQLFVDR